MPRQRTEIPHAEGARLRPPESCIEAVSGYPQNPPEHCQALAGDGPKQPRVRQASTTR